jgi:hypothetical protein
MATHQLSPALTTALLGMLDSVHDGLRNQAAIITQVAALLAKDAGVELVQRNKAGNPVQHREPKDPAAKPKYAPPRPRLFRRTHP